MVTCALMRLRIFEGAVHESASAAAFEVHQRLTAGGVGDGGELGGDAGRLCEGGLGGRLLLCFLWHRTVQGSKAVAGGAKAFILDR